MARRKIPHYTSDHSPIGTIANFDTKNGSAPFRMVTATHSRKQANAYAAKNNGKVQRCTIDGANAFSCWLPK